MDTRTTRIDLIFLHFPSVWILDTQEVSLIKWQTIKGIVIVVTSLADIVVVVKAYYMYVCTSTTSPFIHLTYVML